MDTADNYEVEIVKHTITGPFPFDQKALEERLFFCAHALEKSAPGKLF
jgi:hypothetical protein